MQVKLQIQSMQTTNSLSEEARASNLQQQTYLEVLDAHLVLLQQFCIVVGPKELQLVRGCSVFQDLKLLSIINFLGYTSILTIYLHCAGILTLLG